MLPTFWLDINATNMKISLVNTISVEFISVGKQKWKEQKLENLMDL
jgi:hypothetical protein